jgi:L-ascorbate metabolism protein UlaG (beta-lactamase superfamily)
MKFTWIGQGGILFESNNYRLAVDPYLSDIVERKHGVTRIAPPPMSVDELRPDSVFCTHNHLDHFDPETISKVSEKFLNCVFAGPESVAIKCEELKISSERIKRMRVGKEVFLGGFRLKALPAFHSDPDAVGIFMECEDKKIYISGDTEYKNDLPRSVMKFIGNEIDMMFICINGRLGNMNSDDALKMTEYLRPATAVPFHYGMFKENTADPLPFIDQCNANGIHSFGMEYGKVYEL